MQISTIGIDLAKNVFQVHGVDAAGKVIITRSCGARRCCRCSRSCRPASSAWKPAPHRIIGRASSRRSGTMCV